MNQTVLNASISPRRGRRSRLAAFAATAATALAAALPFAFQAALPCPAAAQDVPEYGTETYAGQPWPTHALTYHASKRSGFTEDAAVSLSWVSGAVNAYANDENWWSRYSWREAEVDQSPLGWSAGSVDNNKRRLTGKITKEMLNSLKFQNRHGGAAIDATWRRVTSGAFVGLLYAAERNDVAAAHNVLGSALYAAQSFYKATNWTESPNRRDSTYFHFNVSGRANLPLASVTTAYDFASARAMAEKQCELLLQAFGVAMAKAGKGEFWEKVKTTGVIGADRERQFEGLNRIPHTFLTAGDEPPAAGNYWLRVRLKTSKDAGAGTNAKIYAMAGGKKFWLDYLPAAGDSPDGMWEGVGSPYDDFEAGRDDAYWIGPFTTPPSELELINQAPNAAAVALLPLFALNSVIFSVFTPLIEAFSNKPDFVQATERRWEVAQMQGLTGGEEAFTLDLDGKDEGIYKVRGTVQKTGEDPYYYTVRVKLTELECVKESKIDGLSSEDEPFLLVGLAPVGSEMRSWRCEPFTGVDTGEKRTLDAVFENVRVYKGSGMSLAVQCWESDMESSKERDAMLQKMNGDVRSAFHKAYPQAMFPAIVSEAAGADWKLEGLEVTAVQRGVSGPLKYGGMYDASPNVWIKANTSAKFPLSTAAVRETGVTGDSLLTIPVAAPAETGGKPGDFDVTAFAGEWETDLGTVRLQSTGRRTLTGKVYRKTETGREIEGEAIDLESGDRPGKVIGRWSIGGGYARSGDLEWVLSEDKNSFTGTYRALTGGQANASQTYNWNGKRATGKGAPASKFDLTKYAGDWYTADAKLTLKQSAQGLEGTYYLPRRGQYTLEAGTVRLQAGKGVGHLVGDFRVSDPLTVSSRSGSIELLLSEDGSAFLATLDGGEGTGKARFSEWVMLRAKAPADAAASLSRWAGEWEFVRAKMTVRVENGTLRGNFGGGADSVVLLPGARAGSVLGRFLNDETRSSLLEFDLERDNNTFVGTMMGAPGTSRTPTGGKRVAGTTAPPATGSTGNGGTTRPGTPVTGNGNTGTVPPVTNRPPSSGGVGEVGDGQPRQLPGGFEVKLERIVNARGGKVEAFFSVKNTAKQRNRIMGGVLDTWIFDADGIGWTADAYVYRGSGEEREDAGILDLDPGDEVTIRYAFACPGGVRPLTTLRMQDRTSAGEKTPAVWNLGDFAPKGSDREKGYAPSGVSPVAGGGEFEELGDWDVRVDGVRRAGNGGTLEVYLTVKHNKATPRQVMAATFRPSLKDKDGSSAYGGSDLYRATGEEREQIASPFYVEKGRETRLCYVFRLSSPKVGLKKLSIGDNGNAPLLNYDLSNLE